MAVLLVCGEKCIRCQVSNTTDKAIPELQRSDERRLGIPSQWPNQSEVGHLYVEALKKGREIRSGSALGMVSEGAWRHIHVGRYEAVENLRKDRATANELLHGIPDEPWLKEPWDYAKHRQITGEFVEQMENMGASAETVAFVEKHRTDKPKPVSAAKRARRFFKIRS